MADQKLIEMKEQVQDLLNKYEKLTQDTASCAKLSEEYQTILKKLERYETNLGVEKVVITTEFDKIMVVIDTPSGSITVPTSANSNVASMQHDASSLSVAPIQGMKGGPPPGMTPEQQHEFKKLTLHVNTLQSKLKELETRLQDVNGAIRSGNDRADDFEVKEKDDIKELLLYLDEINTTLSEKIANQRIEMENISGDTPKAVNYDPFNYGEAYAGDIVDFEARKRIIEIRLLLDGLQMSLGQMRDTIRVSPSIDLGYKIIRLNELIESTGFGPAVRRGEITQDESLLISQSDERQPHEPVYPLKEIFQTDQVSEKTLVNSMMQTMYRLEVELHEVQKEMASLDLSKNEEALNKLYTKINEVRAQTLTQERIEAMISSAHKRDISYPDFGIMKPSGISRTSSAVGQDVKGSGKLDQQITAMNEKMKVLSVALNSVTAIMKVPGQLSHCLTCDRAISRDKCKAISIPASSLPRAGCLKPREKQWNDKNRTFEFTATGFAKDYYQIPRPCGAAYSKHWPKSMKSRPQCLTNAVEVVKDEFMVKGKDGKWYRGTKPPTEPETENQEKDLEAENKVEQCEIVDSTDPNTVYVDVVKHGESSPKDGANNKDNKSKEMTWSL